MPIGDTLGGFIRPGYNPLLVTDAPTIGAATSGGALAVSIAFTAPSDVGGGAITSYEAVATDTVTAAVFTASGSSSPISVTGLTDGQSYTTTVTAINAYGPSGISAASNSYQAVGARELWAWGDNAYGCLGVGSLTDYSSPVQVGALTDWIDISFGGSTQPSTLALKSDGTLWAWGRNNAGQLGQGNTTDRSSPVQIGALTTWSKIASGNGQIGLAIKTDGTFWAWGRGYGGSLGQGNATDYSSPVQVGALTDWLDVASAYTLSMALKTDGTLWMMGKGENGQLGQGNTDNHSSPVQVGALTTWSKIAAGGWWAAALKTDGTIWAWGDNGSGQLGQGNTTDYSSPVQVGALTTWLQVAGGNYFNNGTAMAIKTDGTLWAWGEGSAGELGDGTTVDKSSPVQVGGLTTWAQCSPGYKQSQALKTDGTLWAWGYNGEGQLGQSNTTNTSSPVQVGSLTTWVTIGEGSYGPQRLAIKS